MAKKILIVDDDPVATTLLESSLEKAGYQVLLAGNGRLALEELTRNKPNLIILDVEMPEMNGYMFIMEMKKIDELKDVPVIVQTTHQENQPIFARRGIQHYLIKPVKTDELLAKITALIGT